MTRSLSATVWGSGDESSQNEPVDPERDQHGKAEVEPTSLLDGEQGDAEDDNGSQEVAAEQHLPTAPSVEKTRRRVRRSNIAEDCEGCDGTRPSVGAPVRTGRTARAAWNKPSQNCPVARTVKSCRKRADPRTWRSPEQSSSERELTGCNQSAPDAGPVVLVTRQIGLGNPKRRGLHHVRLRLRVAGSDLAVDLAGDEVPTACLASSSVYCTGGLFMK